MEDITRFMEGNGIIYGLTPLNKSVPICAVIACSPISGWEIIEALTAKLNSLKAGEPQ